MPRRRLLTLLTPTVAVADGFLAADGTAITSLVPAWTKLAALSTNTADPSVDGGRVHGENAATVGLYYRNDWAPSSPDYDVSAAFVRRSTGGTGIAGIAGRIGTAANNLYYARWIESGTAWQLFRTVAGASTQLGASVTQSLVVDQPYVATLSMRGTIVTLLVDGVPIIAVADATVTAPGRAGIRLQNAATSTTGVHLDQWRVLQ